MWAVIDPSRDRIRAESQNQLGDGTIDFIGAGDSLDGSARLISSFTSAAKIIAVTHRQLLYFLNQAFRYRASWSDIDKPT
jgi:hypothetical protein